MTTFATVSDRLPRMARLVEDQDVRCPAGCSARAGTGVLCRIEGAVVDGRLNPSSLRQFCLGDFPTCPTWRAEKDALAERRRGALDPVA